MKGLANLTFTGKAGSEIVEGKLVLLNLFPELMNGHKTPAILTPDGLNHLVDADSVELKQEEATS